ncbi:MAG: hypothetical protein ACJ8LG_13410 [Massilia sp.]
MNPDSKPLAVRRAELIEQCALQRTGLAQEFLLLRSPSGIGGWLGRLASNKKLVLAIAGVGLGFVALHPKRLVAAAAGALSLFRTVRKLLPLLPR